MQPSSNDINILLLATTMLVIVMGIFIILISRLHRKKQVTFKNQISELESSHEKNLLKVQLEIQEQTFHHISKEIHDNIGLSLTLAKLYLHTLEWQNKEKCVERVESSISLISRSITQLTNISQSLNAENIIAHGVLKAIEEEKERIDSLGLFKIQLDIIGTPIYQDSKTELVIFRIFQEALNNIIKHAHATKVKIELKYRAAKICMTIRDNGSGFDTKHPKKGLGGSGLSNMYQRSRALQGNMALASAPGKGTILTFILPIR